MIKLITSCCECVHKGVCRFEDKTEEVVERLKKTNFTFADILIDLENLSNNENFNINVKCTLFRHENNILTRRD